MRRQAVTIEQFMNAIMLAAEIGARLGFTATEPPAKILLRFGGESLLQYHIEFLQRHGIDKLVPGVGHKHQDIERAKGEVLARILKAERSRRVATRIEWDNDRNVVQDL